MKTFKLIHRIDLFLQSILLLGLVSCLLFDLISVGRYDASLFLFIGLGYYQVGSWLIRGIYSLLKGTYYKHQLWYATLVLIYFVALYLLDELGAGKLFQNGFFATCILIGIYKLWMDFNFKGRERRAIRKYKHRPHD